VLVLPLRNPTVAAKAIGTLDVISKGRLILGVAAGWYARSSTRSASRSSSVADCSSATSRSSRGSGRKDRVTLQADEFNLREAVMRPEDPCSARGRRS